MKELEIEKAAEKAMALVDANRMASSNVPRETTISFYRQLATMCEDRAVIIEEELARRG